MNKKEYKKSMSGIHPSEQVVERIMDMTKDKPKKRIKLAPALAIVASLAVVVTSIFGGSAISAKLNPSVIDNPIVTSKAKNVFTITAYAVEGENKKATVLDENSIVLSDYKLRRSIGNDGSVELRGSSESEFSVKGENIKAVTYSCKNGSVNFIVDINKIQYLKSQNKFYDVIIPYLDEYKNANGVDEWEIFKEHFEKGEYDKYFTDNKKKSMDEYYQAEYIYNDDEEITGVGIVTRETFETVFDSGELKEYTFENYFKTDDAFAEVYWSPNDNEIDKLINNKNMGFDEIEHDVFTITVEFDDGSKQIVSYDVGFNSKGNMTIDKI